MKQDIMTDFIRRVERDGLKLAGVAVMQHGEYLGEHRWLYDAAHRLYSLSKSYTATAVGMAVDEGLLKLTDRPMDLFPEALPEHPDPALESLTLRNLLTMASGHDRPYFLLGLREHVMDPDWMRYYLAQPFPYRPGEKFAYDTGTTYVAAAMVEKVSGQKLVDFLMPRLFEKFGIPRPIWLECPMGRALGGDGLHLKTREVLPLGQLYLQKGVWQGERLLSEEFVREATRVQIDNFDPVNAEKPDWISGYGYQFWICQNGAYRGDGAGSQFCIVDEKLDAVIAITADDDRGQDILNAVWETLYPRLAERA